MITSHDNEKLKLVRKLASRRWRGKLGLFVAEGEDLVTEALAAGYRPRAVLVDAERPVEGVAAEPVEPRLLAAVSELGHAPRVIGVFERPEPSEQDARPRALALWRVADPGNVGTLVRSAAAFGASVGLSAGSADPFGPKALRAAMGATFRTPIRDFELRAFSVALVPREAPPLWDVDFPVEPTFVLGSERGGLPVELVDRCDARATIPQTKRAESLNVAMAGTVALYEAVRRSRASAR
jgi:TrmH family RNA methyltransferase